MSDNCNKTDASGVQWHLLDKNSGKSNRSTGMKIEYSMSDEIEVARKLSTVMRKKLMRHLIKNENDMYYQELTNIGLVYSNDTVSEELRKCAQNQVKNQSSELIHRSKISTLSKLFKMYEA